MAANYIKKEDVSTDNIYEYEYADGAFSGYWLKFKYVSVPMDTRDPFNPVQNADAYAVYDAYIFESEVRDTKDLIESLNDNHAIDFFYVEESVYQAIAAEDAEFLDSYSLIPYQITDKIMTVNKYYLPADFDIKDYEQDPDEPVTIYITQGDGVYGDYNINLFNIYQDPLTFGVEYTGHTLSQPDLTGGDQLSIITSKDYNRSIDWCDFYIDDTNHFKIDIYDGTNSSLVLFADIPQDFDFTEDHTYRFTLAVDTTNISNGIMRFVPQLLVDNTVLYNILETLEGYHPYVEFDVSGGTTAVETFQEQFLSNIWMFRYEPNSENPAQDGYSVVGPGWEISGVKVLYMDGSSLTDIGHVQEHVLTVVTDKSLTDGNNTYTLQPMMNIINQ